CVAAVRVLVVDEAVAVVVDAVAADLARPALGGLGAVGIVTVDEAVAVVVPAVVADLGHRGARCGAVVGTHAGGAALGRAAGVIVAVGCRGAALASRGDRDHAAPVGRAVLAGAGVLIVAVRRGGAGCAAGLNRVLAHARDVAHVGRAGGRVV